MSLFNQFSYPLTVIVFGTILFLGLTRVPQLHLIARLAVMGVYAVVVVFIGFQFQYPDSPIEVATTADVESILTNDNPTFLMLYSNY